MGSARTCGRATAAGIALAAMLGWRNARAADDAPVPLIAYSNDALTVRLSGVQNSDILAELARQSGAEIRGQVREPREVTADFESVPLPEALARLLGEQNFALVYGKGGRLKAAVPRLSPGAHRSPSSRAGYRPAGRGPRGAIGDAPAAPRLEPPSW
ncbi:MAG: hypothetical protein E6J59_12000 [Deltaproteobacteria bacterium]|nr:MAG: hypothetical protein E6J59_12000 [Deltaproteobacteria bacterium]